MEKDNIDISIIMGSYNPRKEYLQKAVNSIITQTFKNWEFIIYDDGSDDEHAAYIDEVALTDDRIRVIRGKQNYGLAYGLNQCLGDAKGSFIARMDDDDISSENRLEVQYQLLKTHPEYQWVSSNCYMFADDVVWGIDRYPERPCDRDFLTHSAYVHPAVMFRKEVLDEMNGYCVSDDTMRSEDYELFMRLHANGYRGYNFQKPLFYYREDKDGLKKKKFCFRYREMKIRWRGFTHLGLLSPITFPYVIKPLIVGMIPLKLLRNIRRMMKKDNYAERER